MDERDEGAIGIEDAGFEVGAERRRVAQIASELRRRARPAYLKDQARDTMIKKTTDMKNHAVRSPFVMGVAGALLGAAAAKLIKGATAARREERVEWFHEDFAGDGADVGVAQRLKERAGEVASEVKERAGELKDRAVNAVEATVDGVRKVAAEGTEAVREKLPSAAEVRQGAGAIYRHATEEQPAIGGLIAVGVGLAIGLLLPVSQTEERALAPVKERAAENLGTLQAKVRELTEKLDEKIAGDASVNPTKVETTDKTLTTT